MKTVREMILKCLTQNSGISVRGDEELLFSVFDWQQLLAIKAGYFEYTRSQENLMKKILNRFGIDKDFIIWNTMFMDNGNDLECIRILFHEYAHASGGRERLARPSILKVPSDLTQSEIAIEEMVAETAARKLMDHFGLSTAETNHRSEVYIRGFRNDIPLEEQQFADALVEAQAGKAAHYVATKWLFDIDTNLIAAVKAA